MKPIKVNLNIDLANEAMALTGLKTYQEVVDVALRDLVRRVRRKELSKLEGTVRWDGDLNAMRQLRSFEKD
jgi:Arc/MetJ family transcription regulator